MSPEIILNLVAILISVIAIYTSWEVKAIANSIAQDDFILKHRTFAQAKNFAYIRHEDGLMISQPEKVLVAIINNPAKLISEDYKITDDEENVIDHFEYADGKVLMNGVRGQYDITFGNFRDIIKPANRNYYREIKIKYKSLNSKIEYEYHSKSIYNDDKKSWDLQEENMD